MEGIFFIWELITDNYFLLTLIIFFFLPEIKILLQIRLFYLG